MMTRDQVRQLREKLQAALESVGEAAQALRKRFPM